MRIRVISSKTDIPKLNQNEKMIHLAFRASNVDFINLIQKCPRLRMIQLPPSYRRTISNSTLAFLNMQDIELIEGDVWGHRKDLDEYFIVDDDILAEIRDLTAKGVRIEDVTAQIQAKGRLGPNLIRYIAKTNIFV